MSHNPFLFDALIGNGRLLVCLGQRGDGRRFFWPEVDYGQHLTRYLLALHVEGGPTLWLDDPAWQARQQYVDASNVLRTELTHPEGWQVTFTDAAVPAPVATWVPTGTTLPPGDAWLRRLTVRAPRPARVSLIWAAAMRIDEHPLGQTVLFDADREAICFYRRHRFVAMAADQPCTAFATGHPDQVWHEVGHGHLNLRRIHMGEGAAALRFDLGQIDAGARAGISLVLAAATSHDELCDLLAYWRPRSTGAVEQAAHAWEEWLRDALAGRDVGKSGNPAPEMAPAGQAAAVYQRSLLLLPLVTSAESGGVIAAPEFDAGFSHSGGYGFCWGRDAAFVALAMDRAGLHRLARKAYLWAARTQDRDGWWMQRHFTNGAWAPSWGLLQVDETGTLLFGMAEHYRQTGDAAFLEQVWPNLARGADFLCRFTHAATDLPGPAVDLWEERTGDFAYSAAACWAGLDAVARLARQRGEAAATRWGERAAALRQAILTQLWSEEHGRFLRARALEVYPDWAEQLRRDGKHVYTEEGPKGSLRHLLDADAVVDASLLGISVPYRLLPPEDARIRATVGAVARELHTDDGGIRRYQWDGYRGGNPWVLCTLWLGLAWAADGRWEQAREALSYATGAANPLGYLPEQVDAHTGQPAWVLPLTWSHAMFIMLYRELAAAGKLEAGELPTEAGASG